VRVLAFSDRYLPSLAGPEVALHGFLAGLAARGHEAIVVTATEGPPGARRERVQDGVRVLSARRDPTFARYVEVERPDVVLAQLAWVPDVAAAVGRTPLAALCHAPACVRRVPPGVSLAIYPSRALLAESGPCGRAQVVIPPPIDPARVQAPPADRWAVTAINVAPAKGGHVFAAVAQRSQDRRFLALAGGYGDQSWAFGANVEVRPNGPVAPVLAASRVLLLPSKAETFGMAAVEAQMAGVAVIASDLPALRESLGDGALFVAPTDIAGWLAALKILDDPGMWAALVERGRVNAERYSPGASSAELEHALQAALQAPPPTFREQDPMNPGTLPVASRDTKTATLTGVPILCEQGAPGQNAFTDALVRQLGFAAVPANEIEPYLWSNTPVLVNGWLDEYEPLVHKYPGLIHCVWHSGWGGSGLMGEGAPLVKLLAHLAAGRIGVYWLERRDVPPPGARHLTPVWAPSAMTGAAGAPKRAGAVMAALHGKFPTSPKNVLPILIGAAEAGAEIHVGSSTVMLPKLGPVIEGVLARARHQVHDTLEREHLLRLLSSMDLLIHPSLSETWPVMVMEAVYVGTPAVISDVTAWAALLSDRAQALCIVRPATSSAEIARLTRHLLASAEDRAYLLAEQQRVLDELLPVHLDAAVADLQAGGFPVVRAAGDGEPGLTVFVLTTGEPSTKECLDRLAAQDVPFKLEMVENVAPMDAAFQAMLDRCTTPLYVQVDADMLLKPDAIRTLRQRMLVQPPDVAMYVAWLWGDDVKRPIQGIKIYRHEICRQFPYEQTLSCEVAQLQKLQAAGYRYVAQDEPKTESGCVGVHFACQTPQMAYRRWERLCEKHQKLPWMGWLKDHIPDLINRLLADPGPINRASFIGACVGLGIVPQDREMDFRVGTPEFERLWGYFGEGAPDAYCGGFEAVVQEARRVEDLKKYTGEVHDPREITLYLTQKCTKACFFCKRQLIGKVEKKAWILPGETEPRMDMEPALVRNILTQFPSIESACLAGFGEPLMHPDFEEIVRVLRERNVFVGIITNGDLLMNKREMIERLHREVGIGYLSVSIYGTNREEHKAVTASGAGAWDNVVEGIRHFSQVPGLNFGASYVTFRDNLETVPTVIGLAEEWGLSFLHLSNLLPHDNPDDPEFLRNVLTFDSPEMARIEAFKSIPGAHRVKAWPQPIDLDPKKAPGKCQSVHVSLGVNSWGHTSICRRVETPEEYRGDHFQIEGMWRNEQNTKMRKAMAGDIPLPRKCQRCFGCWSG
jgi:glycosyltransferase involved in cell wall biosynthesis/molybdenum cofactor biosynthesis enzyme MoaA